MSSREKTYSKNTKSKKLDKLGAVENTTSSPDDSIFGSLGSSIRSASGDGYSSRDIIKNGYTQSPRTKSSENSIQFKYRGSRLFPIIKITSDEVKKGHGIGSSLHDRVLNENIAEFITPKEILEIELYDIGDINKATKKECQTAIDAFAEFIIGSRKYSITGQYPGAINKSHYSECAKTFKNMTQNERNVVLLLAMYMDNSRMIYTYCMLYAELMRGEDMLTIANRVGYEMLRADSPPQEGL